MLICPFVFRVQHSKEEGKSLISRLDANMVPKTCHALAPSTSRLTCLHQKDREQKGARK